MTLFFPAASPLPVRGTHFSPDKGADYARFTKDDRDGGSKVI